LDITIWTTAFAHWSPTHYILPISKESSVVVSHPHTPISSRFLAELTAVSCTAFCRYHSQYLCPELHRSKSSVNRSMTHYSLQLSENASDRTARLGSQRPCASRSARLSGRPAASIARWTRSMS
jgi:hypothetical protein